MRKLNQRETTNVTDRRTDTQVYSTGNDICDNGEMTRKQPNGDEGERSRPARGLRISLPERYDRARRG